MNRIQRQAITAAGLIAVLAPTTVMAQRQAAAPEKRFIAVNFRSPAEPKLGIEVGEAVRQRMVRFFPQTVPLRPGVLRIITSEQINAQLTNSGYPADSAITTTDLRDLGRGLGADETLEGTAKRVAGGVEAKAKFYSLNNISAAEILPTVTEKDGGAAGRKIAELYVQARKELPDYERCKNSIINNDLDNAIVAARAALVQYDKGVLPRACLMAAYTRLVDQKKMSPDSVMKVANEIIAIDPENEIALGTLIDAYRTQGDTTKAIEMSLKLYALNPTNTQQAQSIIAMLAASGAPDKALTIVEDQMKSNPGDPAIIETQWKLLQATRQWKRALAAGEEMIKFDSAKADVEYFRRQIAVAFADSQPQLVLQLFGRATAKFPRDTRLLMGYSQELRKQGQVQQALEMAKKAVAVDPKVDNGYANIVSLYASLGQADSAMAFAKQALAASPDTAARSMIGGGLLTLLSPALTKAQTADSTTGVTTAQKRANWEELYRMSATVDSIVPKEATAFFMSLAAFQVGANIAGTLAETAKADKAKGCAEVKYASDMMLVVDLNMGRGGRYNPQVAGNLLTAVSTQLKPYIETVKKQLNCK